jgi:bifunctional pyridoxal-dependent enzyme with beta-cystathionase and maltose regulon repressor activities
VGVAVNAGIDFGRGGEGFVRLNFATSPEVLEHVLDAMARAVTS